jgi:hypothetical protein
MAEGYDLGPARSQGLVDVLDRILDKGLVIAGDVRIRLADVELLTIQIRLLVCSVDKATEIGLDWWKTDPRLSSAAKGPAVDELTARLESLTARLESLEQSRAVSPSRKK